MAPPWVAALLRTKLDQPMSRGCFGGVCAYFRLIAPPFPLRAMFDTNVVLLLTVKAVASSTKIAPPCVCGVEIEASQGSGLVSVVLHSAFQSCALTESPALLV